MSELKSIPIETIIESPVALRTVDEESERFQEIVDSIRNVGILNPINVRVSDDNPDKFVLVDGLHRYTAAKRAGLDELPVQVLDMDQVQAQEAQLIANYHKVDTKPVEYAAQLRKILATKPMMTLSELAGKINVTPTWLSERFKLLKYSDEIKELIDEGKITLSNAYVMGKLPEEEHPNFVDRAMTMNPEEFAENVKSRLSEIREAKKQGRDAKEEEFEPKPKARKAGELKEVFEDSDKVAQLVEGISDPVEAAMAVMKWVLCMDEDSIAEAKAKWEARKQSLEEARTRRKAEREAKKAEEAAEKAAELKEAADKAAANVDSTAV